MRLTPHEFDKLQKLRKQQRAKAVIPKKPIEQIRDKKIKQLKKEVVNTDYATFLKSEYWQKIRKVVLKRDNYKCINCKQGGELHIHHSTYSIRGKEHLNLDKLHTLCKSCHHELHSFMEVR